MLYKDTYRGDLIFTQKSEYNGDQCCSWEIRFADNDRHTVENFLFEILKSCSGDWGHIDILDGDYTFFDVVNYEHGQSKICKGFIYGKYAHAPIKKITAYGGWTNMSYSLSV